jgi:hypothetical protein
MSSFSRASVLLKRWKNKATPLRLTEYTPLHRQTCGCIFYGASCMIRMRDEPLAALSVFALRDAPQIRVWPALRTFALSKELVIRGKCYHGRHGDRQSATIREDNCDLERDSADGLLSFHEVIGRFIGGATLHAT